MVLIEKMNIKVLSLCNRFLTNGVISHMTHDIFIIENLVTYNGTNNVVVHNDNSFSIVHIGNSRIDTFINSFKLKDACISLN